MIGSARQRIAVAQDNPSAGGRSPVERAIRLHLAGEIDNRTLRNGLAWVDRNAGVCCVNRAIGEPDLVLEAVQACEQETATQMDWLRTQMKQAAPQALVVAE